MKICKLKYLILLIALLAPCAKVFAQLFPVRQYTTANELANSNVYDIAHDARGYLWFATERGLSRFDGFKFTNYLFKEGLNGSVVYALAENSDGELFAATKYDGVYVLDNNFKKVIKEDNLLRNEQVEIAGKYLYSLKVNRNVAIVNLDIPGVIKNMEFDEPNVIPNFIYKSENNKIYIATNKGIFISSENNKAVLLNAVLQMPVYSITQKNNIIYAGGDGVYYKLENNLVTPFQLKSKGNINRILADRYDNIWCSSFPQNKLVRINNGNETDISTKLDINGVSINRIFEDTEGNIWLATYGRGVFCIHHLYCSNFTKLDGLQNEYITALESDPEGNLFIGTNDGLYYYADNNITNHKLFQGYLEFIRNLDYENNTIYINIAGVDKKLIDAPQIQSDKYSAAYLIASVSCIINDTIYYSKWDKKVWRAPIEGKNLGQSTLYFSDTTAMWTRVNAIFKDHFENMWIGTTHGLYIISKSGTLKIDTGFFHTNIAQFVSDKDKRVLIATDHGLSIYNNGKFQIFKSIKGKNIENITSLEFDNENRLWIGTLAGLFIMSKENIIQFDTRNGLLSDEINALEFDKKNNDIWIGTTFGLSRIDIDNFNKTQLNPPAAIFKSIRTADSIYRNMEVTEEVTFPYNTTNFTVRFSAIHFSAPEGIKFQYKFDDADWQPAVGRQIEFASIPYGKHTLLLKSIGEQDMEGPVAKLSIVVETPFWATNWFKILMGLTVGLSAYLLLRFQFESVRKKQQEKLELQAKISDLRHQALAASMNPHFIFNALNSIQHFINSHNTEEATDYLGKFARLIRMMLDSGDKTYIPLKDELERLQYYLGLEKIRFGEKLTFTISVDSELQESDIEIPNMVIQPLVENALWHGLLTAKRNGALLITFQKIENAIRVIIDDNGIGINESKKRKKGDHNSLGIQMIRERLEILKKLNGYKATIVIQDKSDLNPEKQGTLVQIDLDQVS